MIFLLITFNFIVFFASADFPTNLGVEDNLFNSSDSIIYPQVPIAEIEKQQNGVRGVVDDFIKIIPVADIQDVVRTHYHLDNEVQRAYTYFQGKDFLQLKENILNIHEVKNFIKFLNKNGLDVISVMNILTGVVGDPKNFEITSTAAMDNYTVTNGLPGLVDDILDTLPREEMLTLFFEKYESSEEFANLIHSIGTDEFNDVLVDMENSKDLRNFAYILHNNGIYIGKIVESLKSFFSLG